MRSWIPSPLWNSQKNSSAFLPLTRLLAGGTVLRTVFMLLSTHTCGVATAGSHKKPRLGGDGNGVLFEVFYAVCLAIGFSFAAIDGTTFGLGVVDGKRGKEACAAFLYTSKTA